MVKPACENLCAYLGVGAAMVEPPSAAREGGERAVERLDVDVRSRLPRRAGPRRRRGIGR